MTREDTAVTLYTNFHEILTASCRELKTLKLKPAKTYRHATCMAAEVSAAWSRLLFSFRPLRLILSLGVWALQLTWCLGSASFSVVG